MEIEGGFREGLSSFCLPGQRIDVSHPLSHSLFPLPDACWRALGLDVPIVMRALSERSELDRAPKVGVRPILMWPDWASMVLGPFAETKGPRRMGTKPGNYNNRLDAIVELQRITPTNRY
jgi:hypothetical protein